MNSLRVLTNKIVEIDGVMYPRVTHILDDVLNKGYGFMAWMLKHGKDEAGRIAAMAAKEGTSFHELVKEWAGGKEPDVPAQHKKRWEEFIKYAKNKKVLACEKQVLYQDNKERDFCGTLDLLFEGLLVDIKTGTPRKEHELQLSAYKLALDSSLDSYGNVCSQGILWLPRDSEAVFVETEYRPEVFLAVREIYKWKHQI